MHGRFSTIGGTCPFCFPKSMPMGWTDVLSGCFDLKSESLISFQCQPHMARCAARGCGNGANTERQGGRMDGQRSWLPRQPSFWIWRSGLCQDGGGSTELEERSGTTRMQHSGKE